MPAKRQRNERWHDYLHEILARGGGIEIAPAPARPADDQHEQPAATSLVWRVRLLAVDDTTICCEAPGTLGRSARLPENTAIVGTLCIGQNRWMFHSRVLSRMVLRIGGRDVAAVRLELPDQAERCARRAFDRISTVQLHLPDVVCSPLLDPASAVGAELLCRLAIASGEATGPTPDESRPVLAAPRNAKLINIGGGGVGLRFTAEEASSADFSRLQWLEIDLRPWIKVPLAVTGRVAHQHIDAEHNVHAGIAFQFAFNPSHRDFVVEQIMQASRQIAAAA